MPNGKVGDHWYTDVTIHVRETFSPGLDKLIRRLDALKREELVALVDQAIDRAAAETGESPGFALLSVSPEFLSIVERELGPKLRAECEAIEARLPDDRNRFTE
jgi:hypothetical protein